MIYTIILTPFFQILFLLPFYGCSPKVNTASSIHSDNANFSIKDTTILPGAYQTKQYLPLLKHKSVGLVINQTSMIGNTSLLDSLLHLGVDVKKIFIPEHGFRGTDSNGATISNSTDQKTGLPLISLYGKNKKPKSTDLEDLDLIIFDIQDVGVRFYTYISTLHYIMESCAEHHIELLVLDRPNPNGFYIDGPVLDTQFRSFIGMHPIPIVYGLTIGELSKMIQGEQWIKSAKSLKLKVIPCQNYTHRSHYILPIAPSPNLPNPLSILLYPSLCLLEGTTVSLGRGTPFPFQLYGHPEFTKGDTVFTPKENVGAKDPPFNGISCRGFSLTNTSLASCYLSKQINLKPILNAKQCLKDGSLFFLKNDFIHKLAGTQDLKNQIEHNCSEANIRQSWQENLNQYKAKRLKYLIYPE
jgi:uncharacterized protein YbbC (DUF1343 family)